jgi:predicted ribosomally synthesized peptide with nif11-like leader
MSANPADSATQLVERLVNDAQFRETVVAAPTLHAKAQVVKAAGYGDVSVEAIQTAMKEQLAALGAGVQVDPERVKRVEALFLKANTDKELQQALQGAPTPEAQREVLAQAGYGDITGDDLRAAAADLAQREELSGEELSDEELDLVSGGAFGDTVLNGINQGAATGIAIGSCIPAPVGNFAMIGCAIGTVLGAASGAYSATTSAIDSVPPPSQW